MKHAEMMEVDENGDLPFFLPSFRGHSTNICRRSTREQALTMEFSHAPRESSISQDVTRIRAESTGMNWRAPLPRHYVFDLHFCGSLSICSEPH